MLFAEEPVQFQVPFLQQAILSSDEINELTCLLQSKHPVNSNSGSDTNRPAIYSEEERKRRRMISNRESARRSRMRKKRHVENLTNQLNRLKIENRELKNRLCLVSHQYQFVSRENDWLQTQSLELQQKLAGLYQILAAMQLQ